MVLTPLLRVRLPRLGTGHQQRPDGRRLHPRPEPLLEPRPLLRRRLPAPEGPVHGEVAALSATRSWTTSSGSAASSPSGAATTTRRRSRPRTRSSPAVAASACTARAGARERASSGEPKPGVGRLALESGVPVVPVAIHGSSGSAAWKRLRFPKVTVQYGEPISFPDNSDPSHEERSMRRVRSSTACGRCTWCLRPKGARARQPASRLASFAERMRGNRLLREHNCHRHHCCRGHRPGLRRLPLVCREEGRRAPAAAPRPGDHGHRPRRERARQRARQEVRPSPARGEAAQAARRGA